VDASALTHRGPLHLLYAILEIGGILLLVVLVMGLAYFSLAYSMLAPP
jgi:hypothetical protein